MQSKRMTTLLSQVCGYNLFLSFIHIKYKYIHALHVKHIHMHLIFYYLLSSNQRI